MATNRQYAEGLLGPRDTSYLDTNRRVANEIYKTNWGTLQNQFENLKNRLEQAREESKKAYATGLGETAERSFDRMNAGTANLISRGVGNSGMADRLVQADTLAKGENVNKLLDVLGNTMVQNAEGLSNANTQVAGKERELMGGLSDTLGEIGQKDLSGQMNYNQAASNIAGSKEARDMENDLAARQRAANERSMNRFQTTPEEDELEALYKKMAINEVLSNPELDDKTKANFLNIMFEKGNANVIIDAYNRNLTAEDKYNNSRKEAQTNVDKAKKEVKKAQAYVDVAQADKDRYDGKVKTLGKNTRDGLINSLANSDNGIISAIAKYGFGGRSQEQIDKAITDANTKLDQAKLEQTAHQRLLDNITNGGITYRDLAKLLYGE